MKSDSVAVEEQQARTDARGSEAAHGSTSDCFRAPGYLTSSYIISVREFCRPGGFFDAAAAWYFFTVTCPDERKPAP